MTESAETHNLHRRRARDQILDALASNDNDPKVYLRLLLHVVEEIGDKIDAILMDDDGLKTRVHNGHALVHHAHHDFLADRIKNNGQCAWSVQMMAEQKAREEQAAELKQTAYKTFVTELIKLAVTVGAAVAGALWVIR